MLLECHEPKSHQFSVLAELLGVDASQDLNHLCSQLEWRLFEFNAFAWGIGEQETEIDMHNVAFNVHHNVTVVAILDL